jgi:hypothetical protein
MRPADRNCFTFAVVALLFTFCCVLAGTAQSTSQDYPTPVTSNEIVGTIKPRDVGDARLTSYYYQFDGSQGDLFINIVTRNFTGDIDVFIQHGLRPLTKIVMYADFAENETGRVIYLRKPEKMILRVQGRPPGDDPATFRIKFAGSFVASSMPDAAGEPTLPSLTAKTESGIRVNSVGTIIEVIPKATPAPPQAAEVPREDAVISEEVEKDSVAEKKAKADDDREVVEKAETQPTDLPPDEPEKKVEVIVTDNLAENTEAAPTTKDRLPTPPADDTAKTDEPEKKISPETAEKPPAGRTRRGRTARSDTPETKPADPLENINLVILFKDGRTIERPMSEVQRFSVDKGILTVIAKDGSVGRYSIIDVAKVTIE